MGSWAYGQCTNDVGAGDLAEGEACLVDNDEDTTNVGCNADPAIFTTLATSDFTNGVLLVCGISSTYLNTATCDVDADCPDGDTCVGDPNPGDGTEEGECDGPGQPSVSTRDTDWYLIPQSVLTDHDADGNGVVGINSQLLGSEAPLANFHIGITPNGTTCDTDILSDTGCWANAGDACDVDADCHSGECVGDPNPGDGNAEGTCAAADDPAENLVIIADYPDGIAIWTGIGFCSGGGDWGNPDYFCSTGNNDHILQVWFTEGPTACAPGPPQGPCNEAAPFGVVGCEDPACCAEVCTTPGLQFCCSTVWNLACASAAVDLGCAPEPGGPVLIATGDDETVEGYLRVKSDPYGAFADTSFGGTPNGSDYFNPASAGDDAAVASFANGFFLFIRDTNSRELLANIVDWQEVFPTDDSLDRAIVAINTPSDTDADGVDDQLTSAFEVTGTGVDLDFALQQNVEQVAAGKATLTQRYTITNNLGSPITFVLQRNFDNDLVWQSSTYDNDDMGTGWNGTSADMYVIAQEPGTPETAVTHSCALGTAYCGAKSGVNPDAADPDCLEYGAGTDTQDWDAYGLPDCWVNHIANVGHNVNGSSGDAPGTDAHLSLEVTVTLPAGPAASVVVEYLHTYGDSCPWGQDCTAGGCIWDCESVPDGQVGVTDFLAILAQWGQVGTSCDYDGGGVGVTDFLELLANWGPCP
jgi:hypothetical protein